MLDAHSLSVVANQLVFFATFISKSTAEAIYFLVVCLSCRPSICPFTRGYVSLYVSLRVLKPLYLRNAWTYFNDTELWWLSGGKREYYQNRSVPYCVLKLCTVISTLRWAVLTVLWIGFCLTGPISLCLGSFVFMFVFFLHYLVILQYVLYYCNTVRWTWWDWNLILRTFLQCFDTVGWIIWPVKTCPRYDL